MGSRTTLWFCVPAIAILVLNVYGGEMSAGTANGGGFLLSTRLPVGGERP